LARSPSPRRPLDGDAGCARASAIARASVGSVPPGPAAGPCPAAHPPPCACDQFPVRSRDRAGRGRAL